MKNYSGNREKIDISDYYKWFCDIKVIKVRVKVHLYVPYSHGGTILGSMSNITILFSGQTLYFTSFSD